MDWQKGCYIKISQYFPKPYEPFGGDINIKVDLSNYAAKTNSKNAAGINTSKLTVKSALANWKSEIDKLVPVPFDLSKLSDAVKMMLLKKLCMIN